ncbi:MAG: hypothetical protein HY917_04765, partial [Candidatus Diapherotrites archaeon]|nr:hypothetical protein [Candidatus Diapherotrites archaeon]
MPEPESLRFIGVNPHHLAGSLIPAPSGRVATSVADSGFHKELTRHFEERAGLKLSEANRKQFDKLFLDVLSLPKGRVADAKALSKEIEKAKSGFEKAKPRMRDSIAASAVQVAFNYTLIHGINLLLLNHGIDPGTLQLSPENAMIAHQLGTSAVFWMEYKANLRQMERGLAPSSAQAVNPLFAVKYGKKGLFWSSFGNWAIDVGKNALPGGGGGNLVWQHLPGLAVRFLLAGATYMFPEWSHRVSRPLVVAGENVVSRIRW